MLLSCVHFQLFVVDPQLSTAFMGQQVMGGRDNIWQITETEGFWFPAAVQSTNSEATSRR